MADYIKRHDALNFELSVETDPIRIPAIREGMTLYADYIKSLPVESVSPVANGTWIPDYHDSLFKCSICGEGMVRNVYSYCPWCGAKMGRRGVKVKVRKRKTMRMRKGRTDED